MKNLILIFTLISCNLFAQNNTIKAEKLFVSPLNPLKKSTLIIDRGVFKNRMYVGADSNATPEPFYITTDSRFTGKIKIGATFGTPRQFLMTQGSGGYPAWNDIFWSDLKSLPTTINDIAYNRLIGKVGNNNYFFGSNSLVSYHNSNTYDNIAIGYNSLTNASNAYQNVAIGSYSMFNGNNYSSIGIGYQALTNGGGNQNVAIGFQALTSGGGQFNVAIGGGSNRVNTTGSYNTILGGSSASALTTGNENTLIGEHAGMDLVTGSNNIMIGSYSGQNLNGNNNIVIGKGYVETSNLYNSTIVMNDNVERFRIIYNGNFGIGLISPTEKLHVSGNIKSSGDIFFNGNGTGLQGLLDSKLSSSTAASTYVPIEGNTHINGIKTFQSSPIIAGLAGAYGYPALLDNDGSLFAGLPNINKIYKLQDSLNAKANKTNVINSLLTGYVSGAGTVASTDNILQAVQKLNGNIALKQNALTNPVTGIGTIDYLSKFTGTSTIGNSAIYENSGNVAIGGTFAIEQLNVSSASAGRMAIDDAGGTNRYSLLFQSPTSTNQYGLIRAYKYGTGAGYKNLVLQDGGGNVGIGTTAPAYKLDVLGEIHSTGVNQFDNSMQIGTYGIATWNGSATGTFNLAGVAGRALSLGSNNVYDRLFLATNGNVGIGTTSPVSKLDVYGTGGVLPTTGSTQTVASLALSNSTTFSTMFFGAFTTTPYSTFIQSSARNDLSIFSAISLNPNGGNVGIGTSSPAATLDVNGFAKLKPMTTTEINAIASPSMGMMAYNSDLLQICSHNGTTWKRADGTTNM